MAWILLPNIQKFLDQYDLIKTQCTLYMTYLAAVSLKWKEVKGDLKYIWNTIYLMPLSILNVIKCNYKYFHTIFSLNYISQLEHTTAQTVYISNIQWVQRLVIHTWPPILDKRLTNTAWYLAISNCLSPAIKIKIATLSTTYFVLL